MTLEPYYQDEAVTVHAGDCLDVLRDLPDSSVDSVVTDPPYNLSFMGRSWDAHENPAGFQSWCCQWAAECLRVLKPGGHLLAFGGTRTHHRLAVAVEDAGFEIRDSIAWLFGSGFPKSLDVSKAIDAAAGAAREVVGPGRWNHVKGTAGKDGAFVREGYVSHGGVQTSETSPATVDAERWQGWGTALKPAHEPIVVARKPLTGTVAANVLAYGTGALNIDACRVVGTAAGGTWGGRQESSIGYGGTVPQDFRTEAHDLPCRVHAIQRCTICGPTVGRWPANVVLDDSQAEELDKQSGNRPGMRSQNDSGVAEAGMFGTVGRIPEGYREGFNDNGGASRFFPVFKYEPKAPTHERPRVDGVAHATVKPLDLMRWLVRLVTPPGGVVLDPFLGSGTTAEACVVEGFRCIGIEREPTYLPLIVARLSKPIAGVLDFGGVA